MHVSPTDDVPRADLAAIGAAVRGHRERHGWSLETLAAESGVSRGTVINVESGRHAVGIDNLLDIAQALGVQASQLIAAADLTDD